MSNTKLIGRYEISVPSLKWKKGEREVLEKGYFVKKPEYTSLNVADLFAATRLTDGGVPNNDMKLVVMDDLSHPNGIPIEFLNAIEGVSSELYTGNPSEFMDNHGNITRYMSIDELSLANLSTAIKEMAQNKQLKK